jgi:hypothetical protein
MNDIIIDHDQTDEDILAFEVSDEALEAAAGGTVGGATASLPYTYIADLGCGRFC